MSKIIIKYTKARNFRTKNISHMFFFQKTSTNFQNSLIKFIIRIIKHHKNF